ncbi:capsule assembly Wzi family protein [Dyadobacter sp. CY326]|uniref:capsule assembly Wzi family protein n=1 Tax=Dyadobacter sp. CY326 TaxID=2907300 RepID=UPI001F2EFB32|nr:capsule assembly Wzi family protein [Dyadobacter sp. CY326]MCE7065366.1 capsule assembly Wzi family protein [Dyadobacter sp. CY326]
MPVPLYLKQLFLIAVITCLALASHAQDSTVYYKASILVSGATDQTPFWAHANQNGSIPLDGNFGLVNAGIYKVYNPHNPRTFQWSGAIQGIGSYGKSANAFLSDAYLAAKIGKIEIMAGQKSNVMGIMDTTLTSGSLSVAGNARPFPRVQISAPNYLPLYFTKNFVALKFSYSEGFLGSSRLNYGVEREVSYTYFHQKSLYFRFGQDNGRLKIHFGANHQAVWGGEEKITPLFELEPLKAYWYTISGKTLNYNKVGNHFGTVDLAGEWQGKKWSYLLYRQNIYETGSLFKLINFQDGLNGLRLRRIKASFVKTSSFALQSALIEVVGTNSQVNRSPLSGLSIYEKGNYYNSYIYQRGWSYFDRGIGTPLAPGKTITDKKLPFNATEFTNNNRFWAFHGGITATWLKAYFGLRATYSRNSGSLLSPFDTMKEQISLSLTAEKNVKLLNGCSVFTNLTSDFGQLYPKSYGLIAGIRKSGFLD